jgi:hypothetical protein
MTSDDDVELVHGGGDVFRDLGRANPEARQLKAILAGQVLKVLNDRALTTRQAQALTGTNHGDFARVRKASWTASASSGLSACWKGWGRRWRCRCGFSRGKRRSWKQSEPRRPS